jgi:hypothetical protein
LHWIQKNLCLLAHYLEETHYHQHCKQWLVCQASFNQQVLYKAGQNSFHGGDYDVLLGFGTM